MNNKCKGFMSKITSFIKYVFWHYFWIGLVLLLISIIMDIKYPSSGRAFQISIWIKIFETVGVSILVSAIFSWAAESKKFASNMQQLLENIIIKRNFLSNIDTESKKSALKSLIQPTEEQLNKYPNISNYYEYFINNTLSISEKNVRSNYHINNRAYFDEERQTIAIEGTYNYRLFPSSNGYLPIVAGFAQAKNVGSSCVYLRATNPTGERKELDNLELSETSENGNITSSTKLDIADFGKGHEHLSVELKVIEIGGKKEQLVQFMALQPTDGFRFELRCEDNISIIDKAIFVVGAKYYVDLSEDKKNITITCNQWINEGSGISILIQHNN